jgi:protein-tyrosine-phosphatase
VIAAFACSIHSSLNALKPAQATADLVLLNDPKGIDDPYGGDIPRYRAMFDEVKTAIDHFTTTIQ